MAFSSARRALLGIAVVTFAGCAPDGPAGDAEEAVNPSRSEALDMSPCNTPLGTFDGTTAYSNGADTGSGYSCAGTGAYGYQYQCVELVMRHFQTHYGLRWYGNAKDLLDNAPADAVSVYANGDGAHPPVPGDMIVWKNGSYGHVALVTDVHPGGIDILEQNVKGNGHATLAWDGATIGARWGNWVPAGWAHADANTSGPPPDPTTTSSGGGTGGSGGAGASGSTDAATTSASAGGGATWSCADSEYAGQQYWTCAGGDIHRCESGSPVTETCAAGCMTYPVGSDDTCLAPAPQWNCADSSYAGGQYWTCSGGDAYRCENGAGVEQLCHSGCASHPLGTDDGCY